jgi:hypothetical protein
MNLKGPMELLRCRRSLLKEEDESEDEFSARMWPEGLKEEMMDHPEDKDAGLQDAKYENVIKGLWQLRVSCKGLESITLED